MPFFQLVDSHGVHVVPWLSYLACSVGLAAAAALVFSFKTVISNPTNEKGVSLPPGPPATWFWQNPMPKQDIARQLDSLVGQYGPMVCFRQGGNLTIVIGRMDAAADVMEKEGGSLVDRPRTVAVGEIMSGDMRLVTQRAGDQLRRLRRVAHTQLQPQAARTYEWIQEKAAKDVILDILNDPNNHIQHADRYAAAVILHVMYGKMSTTHDGSEMVRIRKVAENFGTAFRPGAYLVDFIPWLKYLPWYGRQLREFHRYELALFRDQLNGVKCDMASNNAGPSFAKMLLEDTNNHRLSYDEMAYLTGCLFGAASDTTASGIDVMIMAAACHSDAQALVQDELDEMVGGSRVPTFGDWNALPQLHAFILEALRWRPLVPLGIGHRATKDIFWQGQCIPAGATVLGCHWAISRDPVAFPDPETFNPGRWLTKDGRIRTDMHFYTYGFGRRVCPGQHVANRSLYITLAMILWSFRILRRPNTQIDTYACEMQDTIVFRPKPFEVEFTPRLEVGRLKEMMAPL